MEAAAGVAAAVASVDKFDSGTGSCALSSCCCCGLLGFCCVVAAVDVADDDDDLLLLCAVAVDFGVVTDFSVDCNVTRSDTAGGAGLSPSCPPPAELPSFMFETSEKRREINIIVTTQIIACCV